MERGRGCVERNRSERSKVANVAEWKPPASTEAQYSSAGMNWRVPSEQPPRAYDTASMPVTSFPSTRVWIS